MLGKDTIAASLLMARLEVASPTLWYAHYLIILFQIGYGGNKGIVPIACNEIFDRIGKLKTSTYTFEV